MPRIFLTGASGFIGAEVIRLAQAAGHEVANIDLGRPHYSEQEAVWTKGDVRDGAALEAAITAFAPDIVIHLASDTDVAIVDPKKFTTTLEGTANVIAAAQKLPGLKKLVHVSTQFTVRPGVTPEPETYLEPYTVYGEAKAETERMMRAVDWTIPWLIIRPTIIWGPHHPSFRDAIFKRIAQRAYLHPRGAQPTMRAFGYVRNTAHQILTLALADAGASAPHVFYVGDATIDYDLWADAFSRGLTGKPARRVPVWLLTLLGKAGDAMKALGLPAPIDSGRAFRMSTSSAIDLSRTLALTGEPPVSFEQGVAETLAWLRDEG